MSMSENDSDFTLRMAVAMALLRSKLLSGNKSSSSCSSGHQALRWKRKAKERKEELMRLKEDLKEAEDSLQHDVISQIAPCKCYFFHNMGNLSSEQLGDGSYHKFSDVLRRRFLRQVRMRERRRKADGSNQQWHYSDSNTEDEIEQLRASVDFLVELCDTFSSVEEASFENLSHLAVDFILAALKNLLSKENNLEAIDIITNSLITSLVRRMCNPNPSKENELHQMDHDPQLYVQHLIRKLGSEPYVGWRAMLSISQKVSLVAESLLYMDPFDDAFPNMHTSMFIMIQLIESFVSDCLLAWSKTEGFNHMAFEEWVASLVHARKALEMLESRHGLYMLYMDRVMGELAKQVGQISSLQNVNPDFGHNLLG